MEANLRCYTYEEHTFSKGLLDASVDATYVINLRNNGRYESILKEVTDYKPTSLVYIVLNDGFKKCKKVLPQAKTGEEQKSTYDLVDANLQIYKHANQKKYRNILVLEDDCFFNPDIRDKKILNDLNIFLIGHSSTSFIYRLGCLPWLMLPFLTHVPYGIYAGTHAYVISQKARSTTIHMDEATIRDIDGFTNFCLLQYTYYKPLAYQLFPETENQTSWGLPPLFMKFVLSMIKLLNLDTQAEPGYSIAYILAKITYSLLIILGLFLVYKGAKLIPLLLNMMKPLHKSRGRKLK